MNEFFIVLVKWLRGHCHVLPDGVRIYANIFIVRRLLFCAQCFRSPYNKIPLVRLTKIGIAFNHVKWREGFNGRVSALKMFSNHTHTHIVQQASTVVVQEISWSRIGIGQFRSNLSYVGNIPQLLFIVILYPTPLLIPHCDDDFFQSFYSFSYQVRFNLSSGCWSLHSSRKRKRNENSKINFINSEFYPARQLSWDATTAMPNHSANATFNLI